MNPSEMLELFRQGAKVTHYTSNRYCPAKNKKYIVSLPDGSTFNTQYSVLAPLIKKGYIRSRAWFGGTSGDYIYELIT